MARKPRALPVPGVQAQVITALQEYTQKALAARLGVSERTIRRWKRGETQPRNDFVKLALRDEYRLERDRVNRYTRKEAPGAHPPRSDIPLIGHRRQLQKYDAYGKAIGVWTKDRKGKRKFIGEKYPSDYVNYNVSRLDADSIFGILKDLRDKGATIQLIHRVKNYGEQMQFIAPGQKTQTGLYLLRNMTDERLFNGFGQWKGLRHFISQGNNTRIVYIGVVDIP